MTDTSALNAWFAGVDPGDVDDAARAIRDGSGDAPADWPALAVESGFADDEDAYYDLLHDATIRAAREAARAAEQADDQQLVHALRAMDDMARKVV